MSNDSYSSLIKRKIDHIIFLRVSTGLALFVLLTRPEVMSCLAPIASPRN